MDEIVWVLFLRIPSIAIVIPEVTYYYAVKLNEF